MSIEYDLSTDDGDEDALNLPSLANNGVPGLVVSVEFDDNLSDPVIENGKVRMPRVSSGGGLSRPVEFGSGIASPISGVLCGMSFATGIGEIFAKNGEVYFPFAVYNVYYGGSYSESNVAGAIAGIRYAPRVDDPESGGTSINQPRILPGGLIELPPAAGDSVLRGLVDDDGKIHTWEQVAGYVGSQVTVAGLQLRLAENFYATFMLNVGIKDGYLSFNFSY